MMICASFPQWGLYSLGCYHKLFYFICLTDSVARIGLKDAYSRSCLCVAGSSQRRGPSSRLASIRALKRLVFWALAAGGDNLSQEDQAKIQFFLQVLPLEVGAKERNIVQVYLMKNICFISSSIM